MLAILLAAYLPPPGLPYAGRTQYAGPGRVCGAGFSVELKAGEQAELVKRGFTDAETTFNLREGRLTVRETQGGTSPGEVVRKFKDGVLFRERVRGRYIWHFRDNAPGSTDLYGPSIGATIANSPLVRVEFGSTPDGSPKRRECLDGKASEPRVS